jgi:bifunctional non-homologous end joining protein LigD
LLQVGQGAPAPPQSQALLPKKGRPGWFSQTQRLLSHLAQYRICRLQTRKGPQRGRLRPFSAEVPQRGDATCGQPTSSSAFLTSQATLNTFAAAPDLLDRLLYGGSRVPSFPSLVPDLVILSPGDPRPVLLTPAAGFLLRYCHLAMSPFQEQTRNDDSGSCFSRPERFPCCQLESVFRCVWSIGVALSRKKRAAVGAKASFPGFIEPALATSIEKVPGGERWIHEIKFDGYRVQVHLVNEAVKVFTRRGHDWTHRLRKIADDAWHIAAGSAIIDGEVVAPSPDGTTDFSVLQNELKGKSTRIVLVAFDLLYLNGHDLRKLPLIERKTQLKKIIKGTDIQFSETFEVDGREMFAHACKVGLEGVVSKVRDSRYVSGRGRDWVKKTCAQRETLTIAGFALDGNDWDGIYVGRRKGNDLIYAGKVDHGFDRKSADALRKRLTPLIRRTQPYTKRIAHKAVWVEPELLAEIEYRAKSAEGKVRHPFFRGLREDL